MIWIILVFVSPLIMLVVSAIAWFRVIRANKPHAPGRKLITSSLKYAVIGLVLSLILTIVWAVGYESATGYSAGNAPLVWIFFGGPLGASLGQLVALIRWLRAA